MSIITRDASNMSQPSSAASSPSASPATRTAITVARGDGIGPEIMQAALRVLDACGADLDYEFVEIGEKVYAKGVSAGIEEATWKSLRRTGVFLKAPITTPQGGGFKSLNVTIRKTLGLYANVRPCVAYHPFVQSRFPAMDVVIVRENEEDTYAGIEHRQTNEVVQCLKLISRPGCEKIVRHAFEYARASGRKKVTCFTKDNIMKATDGLFRQVFNEIAVEYPEIENDHWIIDIGAAKLADSPEEFDVIVTLNLYGDIISDIAAQITGSVGLGGSANIGERCAMFEAIHGSAPMIAGQGVANPSGLLLAAVQMLLHVGKPAPATKLHNAWLRTLEDGVHTADIYDSQHSHEKVGTQAFAEAVIARVGQQPQKLQAVSYEAASAAGANSASAKKPATPAAKPVKLLVGVDVFLDWDQPGRNADELAKQLAAAADNTGLKLKMITNRGVKVWPGGFPETFCTDHWRCRFISAGEAGGTVSHGAILALLTKVASAGLDFIKTEHLCTFDGKLGYSLGQGE
ncbi:NADP-dependent isocitrate dehydrogenase [Botrimarina hoheduenensis]|uniref:Isocitrate dehydrogenase [NADP] n=1 Tax=Botrimarina hoheduenensis TaxID=2528000 RepID=A0A5C5W9P8_9BACT|nr:NADP-dependent isocitrate dehydrogenase [Botrimarina hoheduenensis]TWT47598.1 Isocitrate dehydrogenase [NADP] [Botrimarina hoheduenensis]